ncbi:MAG: DUF2516 family protein [Acidimicrobiales bacterium]
MLGLDLLDVVRWWPQALMLLVALVAFVIPLIGVIDACLRPSAAFRSVDERRGLWIALNVIGMFTGVGVVFSLYYLTVIRPRLRSASSTDAAHPPL